MDIIVEFRKANTYYFDIENNIIYGKKQFSHFYYHELRHYKDYSMKWYRRLGLCMGLYLQILTIVFPLYFFMGSDALKNWGIVFLPYAFFRLQEEIRAEIYGWLKG